MKMSKKGFGKLLAGLTIGAGLGMLFAPKKGEDTRAELKVKLDKMLEDLKNVDLDEVKDNFSAKITEIKKEIEELDKEKVKKIAIKKGEVLKAKTVELAEYAKEKGTPVLERTAEDIRLKAVDVTKEVLNKLEENNK